DPLDQVGAAGTTGVHRPLGIGTDDVHFPVGVLLEVTTDTTDGPPGADPRDEVGDAPLGLLPDLRTGVVVVRVRVVHVLVLVRLPPAGDLPGQTVGDRAVGIGVVGGHCRRADHDLGAVGTQHGELVGAHLVRAHEHTAIPLVLGDHGQTDPGVAGGRLHDGAAGSQLAALLGRLDHAQRDTVLDRPTGVEVFDLGQHRRCVRAEFPGDLPQADERGVPDQIDQ